MAKKKKPDKSLLGKKPVNRAGKAITKHKPQTKNPSHITNKLKRSEMYGKYLQQKKAQKKLDRLQRIKETEELGYDGEDGGEGGGRSYVKAVPKTLDSTRDVDPTMVIYDNDVDREVILDEQEDEFSQYFSNLVKPKILVTTRPRPSQSLFFFIHDLQQLIPNLEFYPRKHFSVKEICTFASNRNYTHVMILSQHEKSALCNGMTISHLGTGKIQEQPENIESSSSTSSSDEDDDEGESDNSSSNSSDGSDEDSDSDSSGDNKRKNKTSTSSKSSTSTNNQAQQDQQQQSTNRPLLIGPTVFFKVSNVVTSQNIPNHGSSTSHIPELNLHGFGTRLGHRVGRFLGSLFPHNAQFQGRQVVTFHNQRDYIFVRHHRYIFKGKTEKQIEIAKKEYERQQKLKMKQAQQQNNGDKNDQTTSEIPQPSYEEHIKQRMRTNLQELGPRFTLKLRWVQDGTFDSQFGEYEWYHKRKEMDLSRRKFHL